MTGVRYLTPAVGELERAVERYEEYSPSIAQSFMSEILGALGQLKLFPESAPVLSGKVRRKVLKKYPYSILYGIKSSTLVVVAVMHHRQEPGYWKPRIKRSDAKGI
ncbi:MAG: type II toxin-antitoxin system RelE/ParE family toxin [bacterium]|nr:type II toxin-antitoxin system RelE/ParE family toxin [bacterium]